MIKRCVNGLKTAREKIEPLAHKLHRTHAPAHAIYFALVAIEAGKWYGAVAGGLLVLTLIQLAAGED